ncbi:MAG TPA: hypothetical protein PLJ23_01000 [Gemmatimonadales bacterium]|jgi:hypothetical protein|nr:hypothetical protein [Gemmatimonadales bacterium]
MHFGPGDTLYVKSGPGTVTTLDGELSIVDRFELLSDCQLALPGGGLLCTGAKFDSASGIQQPLHRVDPAGQVLHSFGRRAADSTCLRCAVYLAAGGGDPSEGFWLLTARDYRLERWSLEGALLDSIQVDSDWLPGAIRMIPGGPREGKASGRVWGLQRTLDGMLLVFGSTPTTDQQSGNSPQRGVRRMDVAQEGYASVIELLDPQTAVLASGRFPGQRLVPLAGGMAYSARYDDSGFVMIDVWKVRRGARAKSIASPASP